MVSVREAEKQLERARVAEKRKLGWRSLKTAPKDGTRVHLWMEIYASAMSMGMSDEFAVPDAWWDGAHWVHLYRGQPTELNDRYVSNWMPATKSLSGIEVWRG